MHEIPPLAVFAAIVDFRMEQNSWPVSQQDFINKGIKYYNVFIDFPYQTMEFIVKDSSNMTFHFRDHVNRKPFTYKNFDLNNYGGWATFYKENDKFIWKIKMY